MINIAVCDDEMYVREKFKLLFEEYSEKKDVCITSEAFGNGKELIVSGKKFDLIFLDIDMGHFGLNGIETAQKIRETDMKTPIVYVTNYGYYRQRAFKVHAFDYIEKPFGYEEVSKALDDYLKAVPEKIAVTVKLVRTDGIEIMQNTDKICYAIVNSNNRRLLDVRTTEQEYQVRLTIQEFFELLNSEQFFLSTRSSCVNLKQVESCDEDGDGIKLQNGGWVPLSRRRNNDFLLRLSKVMGN